METSRKVPEELRDKFRSKRDLYNLLTVDRKLFVSITLKLIICCQVLNAPQFIFLGKHCLDQKRLVWIGVITLATQTRWCCFIPCSQISWAKHQEDVEFYQGGGWSLCILPWLSE